MGKVTNKELAIKVSKRIKELLDITELKLTGLAVLSDVGTSAIKSYYAKTLPISLEILAKICAPFSIKIHDFIDFDKPLPTDLRAQRKLTDFYDQNLNSNPDYFSIIPSTHNPNYLENDKGLLQHIVNETDYFYHKRLTQDMVVDFKEQYDVDFESGRLSQMLKSHLGTLEKVPSIKYNKDGTLSKKEVFEYVKKNSSH